MRRTAVVGLVTIGLFSLGCSNGDDTDAPAPAGEPEPSTTTMDSETTTTELDDGDGTFTVTTETFTDDSRPTSESIPQRSLPTDIYVPGGDGPFPLIMHAHGMDGTSAKFSELLSKWAEAGYIVVAPNFPRTNGDADPALRDVGDYLNQPGDVTYVLDQVLAMNEPGGALEGKIATDHMGISGLSLGGATTYPLLYNSCCQDDRYVSGILMSALELPFDPDVYDYSRRIPILVFAGTADAAIPYEMQQDIVAKIAGPKWSVTLIDGQHSQPFENNPAPQDQIVFDSTLDFWALTLRDDPGAADLLLADIDVEGETTVEVTP